jgi:SRSO17 transposase
MLAAESVDPSLADALIQQLRSAERIEDTASMVAEQWLYEHCIYDEQEWHDFFEHIEKKHIAAILEDILHGCENIVADGCGLLAV